MLTVRTVPYCAYYTYFTYLYLLYLPSTVPYCALLCPHSYVLCSLPDERKRDDLQLAQRRVHLLIGT